MNQQSNFLCSEEQGNLRIVEHLDMATLPEPLRQMLSLATTPEEQDILLLATLTAASACMPNLYFRYGPTGKRYSSNLQCFVLAAAEFHAHELLGAFEGIEHVALLDPLFEVLGAHLPDQSDQLPYHR